MIVDGGSRAAPSDHNGIPGHKVVYTNGPRHLRQVAEQIGERGAMPLVRAKDRIAGRGDLYRLKLLRDSADADLLSWLAFFRDGIGVDGSQRWKLRLTACPSAVSKSASM